MEKRNILIVAGNVIYKEDGYKTRIDMALPFLCSIFNVSILIPEGKKKIKFSEEITIYYYNAYYGKRFSEVKNLLSYGKKLKNLLRKLENPIIYCEALTASIKTLISQPSNSYKMVFDCHGTEPNEYVFYHHDCKGKLLFEILRFAERQVVCRADAIITVTEKQFALWNINKPHTVFPMLPASHFFDENDYRKEMRDLLGIDEKLTVYVYLGQAQKWQMCEETVKYYKKLENERPDSFLLILTRDVDVFKKLVEKNKIFHSRILTVDYSEVPKYLDACDFGFCLRNDSIINKVASPTKVYEYISRNVKPILTQNIGDFSASLGNVDMACIVDLHHENVHYFKSVEKYDGRNYVASMRRKFSESYIQILQSLDDR